MGVPCDIYKDFYNVSTILYLNSPPPQLAFIPPSPDSWNSFNRYHFCIYMHVYTFFAPYSLSYPLSSHWCQPSPLGRTSSALLFSNFVEKKRLKKKNDIFAYLR
jgi:hypothetical protein